jgi:hypothetical protein
MFVYTCLRMVQCKFGATCHTYSATSPTQARRSKNVDKVKADAPKRSVLLTEEEVDTLRLYTIASRLGPWSNDEHARHYSAGVDLVVDLGKRILTPTPTLTDEERDALWSSLGWWSNVANLTDTPSLKETYTKRVQAISNLLTRTKGV